MDVFSNENGGGKIGEIDFVFDQEHGFLMGI